MGATSVTGKGIGASYSGAKGPGNGRNFFVPQITPHVIASGTVTLASNTATVTFPAALSGSETNYVVMVTPEANTHAYVSAKTDSGGNFVSFAITGGSTDDVMWCVMNTGYGLDVSA